MGFFEKASTKTIRGSCPCETPEVLIWPPDIDGWPNIVWVAQSGAIAVRVGIRGRTDRAQTIISSEMKRAGYNKHLHLLKEEAYAFVIPLGTPRAPRN
jgi:hypothetical protein